MPLEQEYPDRRFVIFDVTEINKINFDQVFETAVNTIVKSTDETKTFIKYNTPMPSSVTSLNTRSQEYTYEEMLNILTTPEWMTPVTGPFLKYP